MISFAARSHSFCFVGFSSDNAIMPNGGRRDRSPLLFLNTVSGKDIFSEWQAVGKLLKGVPQHHERLALPAGSIHQKAGREGQGLGPRAAIHLFPQSKGYQAILLLRRVWHKLACCLHISFVECLFSLFGLICPRLLCAEFCSQS